MILKMRYLNKVEAAAAGTVDCVHSAVEGLDEMSGKDRASG